MSWAKKYTGLLVGGGVILVLMILFLILAFADWPGLGLGWDSCYEERPGGPVDTCYCETLRDGPIKQLANTFSNFGFIIVGMVILGIVGRDKGRGSGRNPLTSGSWVASMFGMVVILLGPGSMVFHASMKAWAGFLDSTSMFLLLGFLIGYDLLQVTRRFPSWACWLIGGAAIVLFMALAAVWSAYATWIFLIMVGVTLGFEGPIWFRAWGMKRGLLPLLLFLGTFLLSLLIWGLSHTDGLLCKPDGVFLQGHVWWHLGCAVAMGFLFWYLRSESGGRPVTGSDAA